MGKKGDDEAIEKINKIANDFSADMAALRGQYWTEDLQAEASRGGAPVDVPWGTSVGDYYEPHAIRNEIRDKHGHDPRAQMEARARTEYKSRMRNLRSPAGQGWLARKGRELADHHRAQDEAASSRSHQQRLADEAQRMRDAVECDAQAMRDRAQRDYDERHGRGRDW